MTTSAYDKRHEMLLEQSKEAFKNHVIRYSVEGQAGPGLGRWLLQKKYIDSGALLVEHCWDSVFAAEIVALWGGRIYVGGDIQGVEFAYGPGDGARKLIRWMGECSDLEYYVAQKASIGSATGRPGVRVFNKDIADEELRRRLEEERAEIAEDPDGFGPAKHNRVLGLEEILEGHWTDEHELHNALDANLDSDFLCDMGALGMVLDPKVYYAHAAMARLCAIWANEERGTK